MPKTAPPDDRLLTPSELARYLEIDENTLAKWRYTGDGPPYLKLGHRTVRYRPTDVEAWLTSRTNRAS